MCVFVEVVEGEMEEILSTKLWGENRQPKGDFPVTRRKRKPKNIKLPGLEVKPQ